MNKKVTAPSQSGFNLSSLSETRDILFGIATIMILFFHSYVNIKMAIPNNPLISTALIFIKNHCNIGVDMFLFMSGIGLYNSMSHQPKLKEFYKKRATRILPAVFIVSFIWFSFNNPVDIKGYLIDVFFISFFTEGTRNFWYFALIILLYAVYPLIHKLYKTTGITGAVSSIVIVIAFNLILTQASPVLYSNIEIALTRIPVFLMGAFAGKYVKESKTISWMWIFFSVIGILAICIFYIFNPFDQLVYFYRYIGSIFAICHLLPLSAIFSKWRMGAFGTFLVWIGGYSMEIYLIYEKAAIVFEKALKTNDSSKCVYYIAIFFITIIFAIALKAICQNLDKNLFYKNDSKRKQ